MDAESGDDDKHGLTSEQGSKSRQATENIETASTLSQKSIYNTKLMAITLSILNGFSKFFQCWKDK